MKKSIRRQLIIAFISLAIIPLLLLGGIFSWLSYTTIESQVLSLQSEMAKEPRIRLDAILSSSSEQLGFAANMYFLARQNREDSVSFLKLLIANEPFEKILLLDQQGQLRLSLSRLGLSSDEKEDYSRDDVFLALQSSNDIYYSPVWFDEAAGEPLITIARPLINLRTGNRDGALIAQVRLKVMWNLIADVKVQPGQSLYIVDANDRLVAHANPSLVLRGTTFHVPRQDGVHRGLTGEKTLMAIQTVRYGNQEFYVVAEQKISDAFALAKDLLRITAGLLVLALMAAGMLGLLVARRIVWPVQNMAKTARIISSGDLSQRVGVHGENELGVLAGAFNSMTTQLTSLIDGLEQKVAERTAALENAQLELLQQERLATLGKVIATIAHELRNPLGTVNTSIFTIGVAMKKKEPERMQRALVLAERNIRRCDSIITELLDYSRKMEIKKVMVPVDEWIGDLIDEQRFPEGIACTRRLSCGLEVPMDQEHMRRAVLNAMANAVHALNKRVPSERKLIVETGVIDQRVEIRIIDNGVGIPTNLRQKIFEPLFSSKSFGVGLGLSIIKDIMEAHGGGVDIQSDVGIGTTVVLWVPLSMN